jgi:hypothetical protein
MVDLQQLNKHAIQIEHHIADGERLVIDYIAFTEQLGKNGQDTTVAIQLLEVFELIIEHWRIRQQLLLDTIARRSMPPWS